IENRNFAHSEATPVYLGIASNIHYHLVRVEGPLRTGKLAGGHRSVDHLEVVGALLLDRFAGEGEGIRGGQHRATALCTDTDRPYDVIKLAAVRAKVIRAVAPPPVFFPPTPPA